METVQTVHFYRIRATKLRGALSHRFDDSIAGKRLLAGWQRSRAGRIIRLSKAVEPITSRPLLAPACHRSEHRDLLGATRPCPPVCTYSAVTTAAGLPECD